MGKNNIIHFFIFVHTTNGRGKARSQCSTWWKRVTKYVVTDIISFYNLFTRKKVLLENGVIKNQEEDQQINSQRKLKEMQNMKKKPLDYYKELGDGIESEY